MSKQIPDLYLHLGGTHVHHLNYGIFALAIVGAALLFWSHSEQAMRTMALLYGAGMALTFDEFGMWLHLGGSYWQRSSFDAIVVISAMLALLAYGGMIRQLRPRSGVFLLVAIALASYFAYMFRDYEQILAISEVTHLRQIEAQGPQ